MKLIVKSNNITSETLLAFVGDCYNFLFYDEIPNIERRNTDIFSTYDVFDINNIDDDEILYYEGNDLDIIINNFIWFGRTSEKDCVCVISDKGTNDLYYFKNIHIFKEFLNGSNIIYDSFLNNREIKKINKSVVFHPHWGWTDFVISVSIINYYIEVFDEVVLLVFNEYVDFLKCLFPNTKIVSCTNICHSVKSIDGISLITQLYNDDYIFLIDGHQSSQCLALNLNFIINNPTTFNQKLNSYLLTKTIYNIKMDNIEIIYRIKSLDLEHCTFDERVSFYTSSFFDESDIIKYFNITRKNELEDEQFNKYKPEDYIVVNSISSMNNKYFEGKNVFDLTYKSNIIIDMFKIIEESNEIHIYDSLYGTIIYFMYFKLGFCKNKNIYYHRYARRKIPKFYNQDLLRSSSDWIILD